MAKLSSEDAKLFHKLIGDLLFYANKSLNIIKECPTKEIFLENDVEKTIPIRNKIFSDPTLINNFLKENPEDYSSEELNIIASWKKSKKDEFFLIKYEKEQALFYSQDERRVYGILGITDSFAEKFDGYAPIMIKIRFLPFKGKITYEGIFSVYNTTFGAGIRSSLKIEAETAIKKYGIITSLETPIVEKKNSDEEMLRFYMKTQDNRDWYYEEIEKLSAKSSTLKAIYYQEEAGVTARSIRKSLKNNEIKGYFAVLVNNVVASGITERDLDENIKKVVPEDKMNWLYRFKI